MPTFTEILPATKSSPNNCMTWAHGLLTIHTGRKTTVIYSVREFQTPWEGRAFHLVKASIGTDPTSDAYDVFCGQNGQDCQCSCKGFAYGRGKPCKHIEACRAVLANGWLDCPVNLDADVTNTEAPF